MQKFTTGKDLPRSVLDHLLEGCQVIGRDYRYLYVNEVVVTHARSSREELLGRTMMECFPGIEETAMFGTLRACMEQGFPGTMENEFTYPDGSAGWFELRFEPVPDGVVILSVDITERKRAESGLRRTLRALRTLSRCNQSLVRATDEQEFIGDVCRLLVEAGSYDAVWIEFHSPTGSDRVEVARCEAKGAPSPGTGGEPLSFDVIVRGISRGTIFIQMSEQDTLGDIERDLLEEVALDLGYGIETLRGRVAHRSTEQQLVAARRLEAVGRLAGGVAHDFNNLLTVINTYGFFAIEQLQAEDPARRDIEEVVKAGERAAGLTKQLLAFSRRQILEPRVTNLNEVVGTVESMLRRLLGEDIEIRVDSDPELGNAIADPGQLEQVLLNLAVNARDAMPDGGKLTIETKNIELDPQSHDGDFDVEPGRYVLVRVTDTGVGMSSDVRRQVFEPFFTTKETGKGTGLGLSTAYGIVTQSGGHIRVHSEPGEGTVFRVYLPRVDAAAVQHKPLRHVGVATGTETILLVEDDPMVRSVGERILTSAGYRVLSASNGNEALQFCADGGCPVDLLLTDMVMPNMSGRELADRLQARCPDLRVLFTSGYTDTANVHHGVGDAGAQFIGKPFSGPVLLEKVRSVLDME